MSKPAGPIKIRLDLLKPQSNPEKLPVKIVKWLLSSGRYIFIAVEAVVLLAFLARFRLDAEIQNKKTAIEDQIPYIQSLKSYETVIRQTQLKLSTIASFKQNSADYSHILQAIANQTPYAVKIISLNMTKENGRISIRISGEAGNNNDVTALINNLKEDKNLSDVSLASIGIEAGVLRFSANAAGKLKPEE